VYVPVETSLLGDDAEPGAAFVGRPLRGGRVALVIESRRYDDRHSPCFADLVERAAERLRAGRPDRIVDEDELEPVGHWVASTGEVRIEYARQAQRLEAYLGTALDPAELKTTKTALRQIRGAVG
jgi:hypothetical protein